MNGMASQRADLLCELTIFTYRRHLRHIRRKQFLNKYYLDTTKMHKNPSPQQMPNYLGEKRYLNKMLNF